MEESKADDTFLRKNRKTQILMFNGRPDFQVKANKGRILSKQDNSQRIIYYCLTNRDFLVIVCIFEEQSITETSDFLELFHEDEELFREINNSCKNDDDLTEIKVYQSEEGEKCKSDLKQYVLEIEEYERNLIGLQSQQAKKMIQQLESIDNKWRLKLEQKEQELLKVINERQQEINNLKEQLDNQRVRNKDSVEELRKESCSPQLELLKKDQQNEQIKVQLDLKIKQLADSEANLQNQINKTQKIEEIARNSVRELEQIKEENKILQYKLLEAIAKSENQIEQNQDLNQDQKGTIAQFQSQIRCLQKANSYLKNQLKDIGEYCDQSQNDFELALVLKQRFFTQLQNQNKQTLQGIASLKDQLSDSESIIVSYQQEAKKLQETIASQQEQLNSSLSIQQNLQEQLKDKIHLIYDINK